MDKLNFVPHRHLFRNPVLLQKLTDRRVNPDELFALEAAVSAAGDHRQLIRNFGVVERLVQTDRVVVRRNFIGVAVNRQNRRQSGPHVLQRRNLLREFLRIGQAAQPAHGKALLVRAFEDVMEDINTKQNDGRNCLDIFFSVKIFLFQFLRKINCVGKFGFDLRPLFLPTAASEGIQLNVHHHNVTRPNLFAHGPLKIVVEKIPEGQKRHINALFGHLALLKHRGFGNGIADMQNSFAADFDDETKIFNRPVATMMEVEQLHAQVAMLVVETFALFGQRRCHARFDGLESAGCPQFVCRLICGKEK